jgi:hypothetical protein
LAHCRALARQRQGRGILARSHDALDSSCISSVSIGDPQDEIEIERKKFKSDRFETIHLPRSGTLPP